MGTQYIELVNKVLRRLNEVELTSGTFAGARGLHGATKEAVKDSIRKINAVRWEWPFNAFEHTQTLVVGQEEYAWPNLFKVADWDSFQIQKDNTLNVNHKHLKLINRDEWYELFRDQDQDTEAAGRAIPMYVFESHGTGWGVSPSPDQQYILKFRYYQHPTELVNPTDTTNIPSQFDYVIVFGALYQMAIFKDNTDGANFFKFEFEKGVFDMASILINKLDHIWDGRVNFGGGDDRSRNGGYAW